MQREVRIVYSTQLLRSAVLRYWLHTLRVSGLLLTVFLAVSAVGLLLIGDRSWVVGVAVALFTIWTGVIVVSYFRLLNMSIDKFERMEVPAATFRFDDDGLAIEADTGKTEFAWKFVDGILQYPNVWLMVLGGGSYITLPAEQLDKELKAFILEKVREVAKSKKAAHI